METRPLRLARMMLMITVSLDPAEESQFKRLAEPRREHVGQLARQVLEDSVNSSLWREDPDEEWAEFPVALAPEAFPADSWDEEGRWNRSGREEDASPAQY